MATYINNRAIQFLDEIGGTERAKIFSAINALERETPITSDDMQKFRRFKKSDGYTITYWYENGGGNLRVLRIDKTRTDDTSSLYADVKNRNWNT